MAKGTPFSFSDYLAQANSSYTADVGRGIQVMGNLTGLDSLAAFGKEIDDSNTHEAMYYGQPDVGSYHDIKDWTDYNGMADYTKFAISQAVAPMAVTLGAMALGAGAAVAAVPGTAGAGVAGAGAIIGSWLANQPAMVGMVDKAIEDRGHAQNHDMYAFATGSLLNAVGSGGVAHLLSPVAGALAKDVGLEAIEQGLIHKMGVLPEVAKGALDSLTKAGLMTAGMQSTTDIIAGMATGNEFTPAELADRALAAGITGAVSFTGLGAWAGGMKALYNNDDFNRLSTLKTKLDEVSVHKQKLFDQAHDNLIQDTLAGDFTHTHEYAMNLDPHIFDKNVMLLDVANDTYGKARRTSDEVLQPPGHGAMLMNYLTGRSGSIYDRWVHPLLPAASELAGHIFSPNSKRVVGAVKADIFEAANNYLLPKLAEKEAFDRGIKSKEEEAKVNLALYDPRHMLELEKNHPELAEVAKGYQRIYADVDTDFKLLGLPTGWLPNYQPIYWMSELLAASPKHRDALALLAKKYENASDPEIKNVLEKITKGRGIILPEDLARGNNRRQTYLDILSGDKLHGRRLGSTEISPRHRSLEHERHWPHIPPEELAKAGLIHTSPSEILTEYLRSASKRYVSVKTFGADEEILRAQMLKASEELRAVGKEMTRTELNQYYGIVDAFHNMYRPIVDQGMRRASSLAITSQYVAKLPLSLLASLTEPLVMFERMSKGNKSQIAHSLWVATQVAVRGWEKTLKKYPKDQALRYAQEAGVGLDSAVMERLSSVLGNPDSMRATFRVPLTKDTYLDTEKITENFFRYNGLGPFTRLQKIAAFHLGMNLVEGNLKELMSGKAELGTRRHEQLVMELRDLGINPREGIEWVKRGSDIADNYYPNIRLAGMRFNNDIVMHPQANTRPLWHSNPHVALISQLKGFQTQFGNVVIRRWLTRLFQNGLKGGTQAAMPVLGTAASMMMLAGLVAQVKQAAIWYPNGDLNPGKHDPLHLLYQAQNNMGLTGGIQFALDAINAHTFGERPVDPLIGPFYSGLDEGVSSLGMGVQQLMDGKSPQTTLTWVLKQLPGFGQLPGLRAEMIKHLTGLHF
jgi:hypothetical protein